MTQLTTMADSCIDAMEIPTALLLYDTLVNNSVPVCEVSKTLEVK